MIQDYFSVRVSGAVRAAMPVADVEGVLQLHQQEICPIPGVNPFLLGVVNKRGHLVWVLHLSKLLGLPNSRGLGTSLTTVLVGSKVKHTDSSAAPHLVRRVACVVAELEGIISLSAEQLRPKPGNLKPQVSALSTCIASKKGMPTIFVLDSSALFNALYSQSNTSIPL